MNTPDIPHSLVESYNAEYARGTYMGTLDEFISVTYLIYRAHYSVEGREPPSKTRWLQGLREFERMTQNSNNE